MTCIKIVFPKTEQIKIEGDPYKYSKPTNDKTGPFYLQFQNITNINCSYYGLNAFFNGNIFNEKTIAIFYKEYNDNIRIHFKKWVNDLINSDELKMFFDKDVYEFIIALDFEISELKELDITALVIILSLDFTYNKDDKQKPFTISKNTFYPINKSLISVFINVNPSLSGLLIKTPECFKINRAFTSGHVTVLKQINDVSSKYNNKYVLLDSIYGDQCLVSTEYLRFTKPTPTSSMCSVFYRTNKVTINLQPINLPSSVGVENISTPTSIIEPTNLSHGLITEHPILQEISTDGMGLQTHTRGTPVPRNSRPPNPFVPFWLASPEKKGGLKLNVNSTNNKKPLLNNALVIVSKENTQITNLHTPKHNNLLHPNNLQLPIEHHSATVIGTASKTKLHKRNQKRESTIYNPLHPTEEKNTKSNNPTEEKKTKANTPPEEKNAKADTPPDDKNAKATTPTEEKKELNLNLMLPTIDLKIHFIEIK